MTISTTFCDRCGKQTSYIWSGELLGVTGQKDLCESCVDFLRKSMIKAWNHYAVRKIDNDGCFIELEKSA